MTTEAAPVSRFEATTTAAQHAELAPEEVGALAGEVEVQFALHMVPRLSPRAVTNRD